MTILIFQSDFPHNLCQKSSHNTRFKTLSSGRHRCVSQIPPETFLIRTPDLSAHLCKDAPKVKPILTLSHCRRSANKSNCSQNTRGEPGTPSIAQGLITEPQKETKKLFHFFLCSQPADTSSTYPTELLSFFRTNSDSPKKSTE